MRSTMRRVFFWKSGEAGVMAVFRTDTQDLVFQSVILLTRKSIRFLEELTRVHGGKESEKTTQILRGHAERPGEATEAVPRGV